MRALEDADRWPNAAAALLAELGFRLVAPVAGGDDAWHLLVALRGRPTLRHFDPESLAYYAPSGDGARLVSIDRATTGLARSPRARAERVALWGHVHVLDRVPVENRFLTFGGDLLLARIDPGLTVVALRSPAPIVRWGGHSQGTDEVTLAIGAFFGRLIVPVDFAPGAAARVDAQPPGVLYRAFLADALRRVAAGERRGAERAALGAWIGAAWLRARADAEACDRAHRLLRELNLA